MRVKIRTWSVVVVYLSTFFQDFGYDGDFLAALEEEAIGIIQPSRMPGSLLYEEAVHLFAARARAQMSTNDPALVTYDMAVSVL